MALTVTQDAQTVFFSKVFGNTHPVTNKVKFLIAHGVTFEIGMYVLTASVNGMKNTKTLTIGSTAMMKGSADTHLLAANKLMIQDWVGDLASSLPIPAVPDVPVVPTGVPLMFNVVLEKPVSSGYNTIAVLKLIQKVTEQGLVESKKQLQEFQAGLKPILNVGVSEQKATDIVAQFAKEGITAYVADLSTAQKVDVKPASSPVGIMEGFEQVSSLSPKKEAVPTSQVIQLREAMALGQPVKGTSSGSVYRTVAVNKRVKVAARIYKSGSVSIRAEWKDATPTELDLLKQAGLDMKKDYASIHFNVNEVPPGRVIGAFVIGLGIEWDAAVNSSKQLVIEEK